MRSRASRNLATVICLVELAHGGEDLAHKRRRRRVLYEGARAVRGGNLVRYSFVPVLSFTWQSP